MILLQEIDLDGAGYREGSGLPGGTQVRPQGRRLQKLPRHQQDLYFAIHTNCQDENYSVPPRFPWLFLPISVQNLHVFMNLWKKVFQKCLIFRFWNAFLVYYILVSNY